MFFSAEIVALLGALILAGNASAGVTAIDDRGRDETPTMLVADACPALTQRLRGLQARGEEPPAYLQRALEANACLDQVPTPPPPTPQPTIERLQLRIDELERAKANLEARVIELEGLLEEAHARPRGVLEPTTDLAPEVVALRHKIEDAFRVGRIVDFTFNFLAGDLGFSPNNKNHRATIFKGLHLDIKETSLDDLYAVTPQWTKNGGERYKIGKNSGELAWLSIVGVLEPYRFYLFAPGLGWRPSSGRLHIAPHSGMRSFALREFNIRMSLDQDRTYEFTYHPKGRNDAPGCGSVWVRMSTDVVTGSSDGIRDILFVRSKDRCFAAEVHRAPTFDFERTPRPQFRPDAADR